MVKVSLPKIPGRERLQLTNYLHRRKCWFLLHDNVNVVGVELESSIPRTIVIVK